MTDPESKLVKPLLFFDTGIGGLSVLRESQALIPGAPIIYAADYAGMPYGMKSETEIAARIPALLGRLVERYKPQLVTIACNTASTIALDFVRSALDIPVVGTVPAVKPASQLSKTRTIGLLGTKATIRQAYVDRLVSQFAADTCLLRFATPELVYAAEAKLRGEKPDPQVLSDALSGLLDQDGGENIDVIILACTHFPLVEAELQKLAPRPIKFVDGAKGIARRIRFLTADQNWPEEKTPGKFVTTGSINDIIPYHKALEAFNISIFETL